MSMPPTRFRPPEIATSNRLKLHRPWRENATGGGFEVLFPYPGRVRGGPAGRALTTGTYTTLAGVLDHPEPNGLVRG